MDLITQGLLGATVSYAVTGKKIGSKKSVIWGAFFGMLPDSDIIWQQFTNHLYFQHRGISHSLFFAPVIAFLVGLFVQKKGYGTFKDWFLLSFWALITHPLLDFFTSYGTPLLLPFSNYKICNEAVSVLDPLYSILHIFSIGVIWFSKKENIKTLINGCVLFLSTAYLFVGFAQQDYAQNIIKEECKKHSWNVDKCKVSADKFSIFYRKAICKDNGIFHTSFFSTLSTHPLVWNTLTKR